MPTFPLGSLNAPLGSKLEQWLDRRSRDVAVEKQVAAIVLEVGCDVVDVDRRSYGRAPGDEMTLRGIPVIGAGGGAMLGTRPDTSAVNRQDRLARKLAR